MRPDEAVGMAEDGLSVFAAGAHPESTGQPSVFSGVDQEELIAQIGTVDDDLSSGFFKDSFLEVEDAATAVFDIGIRLLAEGATAGAPEPPGMRGSRSSRGVPSKSASVVTATPIAIAGVLSRDNAARRAFVLGGPAALAGH